MQLAAQRKASEFRRSAVNGGAIYCKGVKASNSYIPYRPNTTKLADSVALPS